jgi:cytochrome c peroxidase
VKSHKKSLVTECLAEVLILALVVVPVAPVRAEPGDIVVNGASTGIPTADGFLFEPEVPFQSLKHVPTWSELEQMLDNPYAFAPDPGTPGNDQGFPSYRSNITRRPSFLPQPLPQFHVHPLNYNTLTGEEMRLINPNFPETEFDVIDQLVLDGDPLTGTYTWVTTTTTISAGADRVEEGSIPIDYNNPIGTDDPVCVTVIEVVPPEGAILCGGDPGEPGYFGFGVLRPIANYSTPAVPLSVLAPPAAGTGFVLNPALHRLWDPQRLAPPDGLAGFILPRSASTGAFGLRKPSLRVPQVADMNGAPGSPAIPAYTANVDPDDVTASNENDFIRSQTLARVLGKALFWDMQVGSDGVQSCGTCHFNGTGTDSRVKNQLNPNHLGNDLTFQVGDTNLDPSDPSAGKAANYTLTPADFPLHRVTNPDVAGDPACTTALTANVSAIPYDPQQAGYQPSQRFSNPQTGVHTVCDAANTEKDVNDVVSSMGVHWGIFKDIPPIGQFISDPSGVAVVPPDLRETATDCNTLPVGPARTACLAAISDPIPGFAGAAGTGEPGVRNEFRRVEPRNTPTMQAAAFNFDNFWDGRARHDFNGASVFGAADPQAHVFVCESVNAGGTCTGNALVATRQIIRFVSIASLATGPALSEFEMSLFGRNWSKLGKKLLQPVQDPTPAPSAARGAVTPLGNQLVSTTDSVLGPYSNQGGSACASLPVADRSPGSPAPGKPGLCISYLGLIRQAFYPALWGRSGRHLNGCYTDGRTEIHPNQCGTGSNPAAAVRVLNHDPAKGPVETVLALNADPFDGYVLSIANGAAVKANTNQFTQMEANFSLFWGLSVNAWIQILVPDDTPFDRFQDINPDAFAGLGEPGEFGLVSDLPNCTTPGQRIAPAPGNPMGSCFTPYGNFKRDPGLTALLNALGEGGGDPTLVTVPGTRNPSDPDPLLGLDIFFSSNLSLKNPNFRTGRCGECHAIPTLTDHTMPFTSKINLMDAVAEFVTPGVELVLEPLARLRVITGFLLESELVENGQDAIERRIVDQSIVPNPVDGLAYPGATAQGLPGFGAWTGADQAFLDNGMYNLGIRPISEDIGRGGNDAFGWPLSLSALMLKNLAGPDYNPGGDDPLNNFAQPPAPGIPILTVDALDLESAFEPTAQDPQINPGFEGEPANPMIPSYIGDFANNLTVGDFPPEVDEAGGAIGGMVNVLTDVAMIEGFMDNLGPFNPGNTSAEVLNFGGFSDRPGDLRDQMGTWPNVNRVGRMGSFKAAPLRNVELTGPYFHNGGKLTLRQVVDFYTRGGDFPISNSAHRDFNLVNMNVEIQSNLSEEEKVALVDFLLEITDERNRFARAPFDKPEVIVPMDGLAPDNKTGRTAMLADPRYQSITEVGAGGTATPEPSFMNLTKVRVSGAAANRGSPECDFDGSAGTGRVSHYCH